MKDIEDFGKINEFIKEIIKYNPKNDREYNKCIIDQF